MTWPRSSRRPSWTRSSAASPRQRQPQARAPAPDTPAPDTPAPDTPAPGAIGPGARLARAGRGGAGRFRGRPRGSADACGDSQGTLLRPGPGGVNLHVVADPAVHHGRLGRSHAGDTVAALELAAGGGLGVAADPHPQHAEPVEGLVPPALRAGPAQEHLVDDDPSARPGDGGDT